jgi:hypothetical protein
MGLAGGMPSPPLPHRRPAGNHLQRHCLLHLDGTRRGHCLRLCWVAHLGQRLLRCHADGNWGRWRLLLWPPRTGHRLAQPPPGRAA